MPVIFTDKQIETLLTAVKNLFGMGAGAVSSGVFGQLNEWLNELFAAEWLFTLGSSIWNWFADAAFSILGTSPAGMGGGTLWGTASSVSEILSILSATLVTIFALIDFLQNTADIRHGVTMEGVLLALIKIVAAQAILLNLKSILASLLRMSNYLIKAVSGGSAADVHITMDSVSFAEGFFLVWWVMGILYELACVGCGVILIYTVYVAYIKIFFYAAIAPLPLSTLAGPREAQQSAFSWFRAFIAALLELMGMALMLRLGSSLVSGGGLLGGTGRAGTFGFAAMVQLVLGVVLITGSVKAVDALIRRAVGV